MYKRGTTKNIHKWCITKIYYTVKKLPLKIDTLAIVSINMPEHSR